MMLRRALGVFRLGTWGGGEQKQISSELHRFSFFFPLPCFSGFVLYLFLAEYDLSFMVGDDEVVDYAFVSAGAPCRPLIAC